MEYFKRRLGEGLGDDGGVRKPPRMMVSTGAISRRYKDHCEKCVVWIIGPLLIIYRRLGKEVGITDL